MKSQALYLLSNTHNTNDHFGGGARAVRCRKPEGLRPPAIDQNSPLILRTILNAIAIAIICSILATDLSAQHRLFRSSDAPGLSAHKRLIAEPAIANYDQPVNVILADGGELSFWDGGQFTSTTSQSLLGMQVGPVYRLKTTIILRGQELTVYPTLEMLDRLYPPAGLANRHPVKLVITDQDIEDASQGNLVTKVIYLEDPDTALPYRQQHNHQSTLDVGLGQDPFQVADRLGRPVLILRIGSRLPTAEQDSQILHSPTQLFVDNVATATEFQSLESNTCAADCNCNSCQDVFSCCPEDVARSPNARRDEYICDGDDRELKVVALENWELLGLDIEDTIAHFDTLDGKIRIAPSNRVCIYSPRFAAVRRTLRSNNTTITQKLSVVNENVPVESTRRSDFSTAALQNVQIQSNKTSQRPNAFRVRTRGVATGNTVHLLGTRHFFKPFEDLQLVRFGKYSSAESARLSLGMQSAVAWESDLSAQIAIDGEQPVIVNDVYRVQEFVSIESDSSPDLRLCKLASTISAQLGEVIDFTIRFDNIGRQRIGNVTIIDNLSPRLEFVEKSAECSIEATFKTELNEAGSLKLSWEILETLDVGSGGLIRFQCRVR